MNHEVYIYDEYVGDNSTTVKELKDEIKAFCEERDWGQFHNPKENVQGLYIRTPFCTYFSGKQKL